MMCCSASTLRPMRDESMCAERRAPQNQTSLSHAQPSRCTAWRRSAPRRARAAPTDRLRHGGIGPGHQRRGAALCRGTGRLEASREGSARERGKAPCGGRPRLWRPGHCEVPRRLSRFRCRAVQRGRAAAACGACGLLPAASKLARGERQWPGRAAVGGVQRERDGREAPAAHGIAMPCQHAARVLSISASPVPLARRSTTAQPRQGSLLRKAAHAAVTIGARDAAHGSTGARSDAVCRSESPARRVTWRGLVDQLLKQIGACGAQPTGREPCEPVDCLAPQHARRCLVRACRSA